MNGFIDILCEEDGLNFSIPMQSQLTAARQSSSLQTPFGRLRVRIRRDRIIEDAFAQLNPLSEDSLRGTVSIPTPLTPGVIGSLMGFAATVLMRNNLPRVYG